MSQPSKNVDWCLNKAKKELEECVRLGKRPKHRGLVKSKPDMQEAQNHLKKAEENLEFAISISAGKYNYKMIESLFYCMYQCFLSIATKFGYTSGNQTCTINLISYLNEQNKIDLDEKFIEMMKYKDEQSGDYPSIIDMREDQTYNSKVSMEKEKMEDLVVACQELIEKTKQIMYLKD